MKRGEHIQKEEVTSKVRQSNEEEESRGILGAYYTPRHYFLTWYDNA
jgi:hypothetical protein